MKKKKIWIGSISTIIWGSKSNKLYIAIHGDQSHKESTDIMLLANEAVGKGYQVLSFDLPEHGDRKKDSVLCKVQNCVEELTDIMDYAKSHWKDISLYACSLGAYFILIAYKNESLQQVLFLSPVVDMKRIIENMMQWFDISVEKLKQQQVMETPIKTLYWDYYCYVKRHPITTWNFDTHILYGANDTLCENNIIQQFTKNFHCYLDIIADMEHYFHTEAQLQIFKEWLQNKIY